MRQLALAMICFIGFIVLSGWVAKKSWTCSNRWETVRSPKKRLRLFRCIPFVIWVLTAIAGAAVDDDPTKHRVIIDHRGVPVPLPDRIDRVVTLSDGFIEAVMTVLGVQHTIVGIGSPGLVLAGLEVSHESISSQPVIHISGVNTVTFLNPWFRKLPLVARPGSGINHETLMSLEPDSLIIQLGACALLASDEKTEKNMRILHTLGIPTVVLRGPNTYDEPRLTGLSEQICILGEVFGQSQPAKALVDDLAAQVSFVRHRTQGVDETTKRSALQ